VPAANAVAAIANARQIMLRPVLPI
jgi:hypothetical protein